MSLSLRKILWRCAITLLVIGCARKEAPPRPQASGIHPGAEEQAPGVQQVRVRQGESEHIAKIKTEAIVDGCSMEVASSVLKKTHPAIKLCGQAYAEKTRERPIGKMVFTLVLKKDGWPGQVAATRDEVGDSDFASCIKQALQVQFPNPYGKQCVIQAPFSFTAAKP